MPILTKPALVEKGVAAEFELDKSALALHPTVVADNYFSSPNNWSKIQVKYKSNIGGQFEVVEFDATVAEPIGRFFVSETAKDLFEVEKITIVDHDGGILVIPRASLTSAEFDISFL
jgi:predicted nucleotidyltransferase component of viral defense system